MKICDNIVFLIRRLNAEEPARRKEWEAAEFGLKEIAIVDWRYAGFPPEGRSDVAAMHWQRGYKGDVRHSKVETERQRVQRYMGVLTELASIRRRKAPLESLSVAAKDLPAEDRSELFAILKRLLAALRDEAVLDAEMTMEAEAAE